MSGRYQVPAAVQPVVDAQGRITNPWWQWALSIGKNAGDPIDWSVIVNTPTTLNGYGITDAYTKTEVDALIADFSSTTYQTQIIANKFWVAEDFLLGENIIGVRYMGPSIVYLPADLEVRKIVTVKDETGLGLVTITTY